MRLLGVLAAGAAWVVGASAASAQVAVDALELGFPLAQARTAPPQTFRVTNAGTTREQVTITMQDWDRSETGENRYFPLGTVAQSCRNAIRVFPTTLQVEPGASATVRVWVDSNATLPASCHSILFVETARPAPSASSGLRYSLRYGVKVYVESSTRPTAEIVDAEVARVQPRGDSLAMTVVYRNTGARQTIARGRLEVRRADNSVVATLPIDDFAVLPGATRRLSLGVPRLPQGQYVLLALIDFGGAEIAAAQAEVEVP